MRDRPIIYSAPNVHSILAGTKTQTRRVVKEKHLTFLDNILENLVGGKWDHRPLPYGKPGDRLWVRETWMPDPPCDGSWNYTAWSGSRIGRIAGVPEQFRSPEFCAYAASRPDETVIWTPAIHMPRWASRITLEVTGVRVERLQDITEADCIAEGIESLTYRGMTTYRNYALTDEWAAVSPMLKSPIESYRSLWESINGPGSWDANPRVWVIEFKRV